MSILRDYTVLTNTPAGQHHYERYMALKTYIQSHQDELYNLIFSTTLFDLLPPAAMHELIWFGRDHGGSCRASDSPNWKPFFDRVFARKHELPPELQQELEWHRSVHGW